MLHLVDRATKGLIDLAVENQMLAEFPNQALMCFVTVLWLSEPCREQGRLCRVIHGVIGAVACALGIAAVQQQPRGRQSTRGFIAIGQRIGGALQSRNPSRWMLRMSAGLLNVSGRFNSSTHSGRASTRTPVSIITSKAMPAMSPPTA